ncbi:hypothetical protein Lesp02_38060 [Lentzea sp. NBRC 105346]|uniref:FtsX-like permease family protein n=1 Tax=Lentzea sp. NBRC 105346 TaxID=3032205 RepID=UPI0024A1578F|nr:FtsX-like permease family protein [Lentzea sp. NBRC 105346]GLZ31618.1 hypothetical protein Lesp02_38060 [Lentzea sp. NBRC 105346]
MSGWRTALRIAWREARRAKGRAALVIAMIALPVAGLSFAAVGYDTFTLTPQERSERLMGTAEAAITWAYNGAVIQEPDRAFTMPVGNAEQQAEPTEDRLKALLPPGTRLVANHITALDIHTLNGTAGVRARLLDYENPLARGILRQVSGRAPASDDEVALTQKAVSRTGAGIGGTIRTTGGKTYKIVGIVEEPDKTGNTTVVLRPGALTPERGGLGWLATSPLTWAQVKELNQHGIGALSRQVIANPPPMSERYPQIHDGSQIQAGVLALIGGLAVLEIVLLAGPALAVGARRRRRDLALVSASGGTPAHIRRIVLADGVVFGGVAAVAGVVIGVVTAVLGVPLIERFLETRSGALRLYPQALVVLAVLAVVTGVLAALVPAWISARQDVVTALAGRRGITRSRRRWLVAGLVLIALGAGVAVVGAWQVELTIILGGLAIGELGLVLITPSLVGLVARLGRLLPVPVRIALRDTSRNRTAAAPAISAVMAVVISSLAVGLVINSGVARDASESAGHNGDVAVYAINESAPKVGESIPDSVVAALRGTLPIKEAHEIRLLSCDDGPCFAHAVPPAGRECPYLFDILGHEPTAEEQRAAKADSRCDGVGQVYTYFNALGSFAGVLLVIDPAAARSVADLPDSDVAAVTTALREGKIVVDSAKYLDERGVATIAYGLAKAGAQRHTVTGPGFVLPHGTKAPMALITQETARGLGFGSTPFTLYATTTREPTVDEQDRAQAVVGADYELRIQRAVASEVQRMLTILAIVAAVITLGAAALATGLAAADGRSDLTTLAAVGASPSLRRLLSLSQSGVIAGLGSVLGTVAGLGTSVAVLTALNQRFADQWPSPTLYPITVPWVNVAVALVVVPLVAMLGAGLLTRSRLPIERRE